MAAHGNHALWQTWCRAATPGKRPAPRIVQIHAAVQLAAGAKNPTTRALRRRRSLEPDDSWPRISTSTLADQVYSVLRDRIVRGEIAPGAFIREQEVSEALGVSRTPVREALGRLASEGFAERIPHRGFRVPEESVDDLLELYPIVAALEVLAARATLPTFAPSDLEELRTIQDRFRDAVARDDPAAGIEHNRQFHHLLSFRSGNRHLAELLDELRSRVVRLELWSFAHISQREESVVQHDDIIRAIEKREFDRALSLLEYNRMQTYRDMAGRGVVEGV
jgi:DNA-binding GntR family transcriptional regulator